MEVALKTCGSGRGSGRKSSHIMLTFRLSPVPPTPPQPTTQARPYTLAQKLPSHVCFHPPGVHNTHTHTPYTHTHPTPSGASLVPALGSPLALFRGRVLQVNVKVQPLPPSFSHDPAVTPQEAQRTPTLFPSPCWALRLTITFWDRLGFLKGLCYSVPSKESLCQ